MDPFDILREFATKATARDMLAYQLAHPALMAPAVLQHLTGRAATDEPLLAALAALEQRRAAFERDHNYPFGFGPLERIWQAQQSGEIALDQALLEAASPAVGFELAPVYVKAVVSRAPAIARGRWRDGLALARIVLCATSAADGRTEAAADGPIEAAADAIAARTAASLAFISVATVALLAVPDGRILAQAEAAGEWLCANAADAEIRTAASCALGCLYFEPYYFSGDHVNYAVLHLRWQQRFEAELGMAYAAVAAFAPAMPAPQEALASAERHLRDALAPSDHDASISSLETLVRCVRMQTLLFEPARLDELRALADALIALADARTDASVYVPAALTASLVREVEPREILARITELYAAEPNDLVERFGAKRALAAILASIKVLQLVKDARGRAMLERYRDMLSEHGNERERYAFWNLELDFFKLPAGEGAVTPLMTIVERAQARNREDEIVTFLEDFGREQPAVVEAHRDAFAYLRYLMNLGLAANAVASTLTSEAIARNGKCLMFCLQYGFDDGAIATAARIDNLASRAGETVAATVATTLRVLALLLELTLGERGMRFVQSICRHAFANMLASETGRLDVATVSSLLQSAKNHRLARAVRDGARYAVEDDAAGKRLLGDIERLERGKPQRKAVGLDEHTLLSAYLQESDCESGATSDQRVRNLQRAFDRRVEEMLASTTPQANLLPAIDIDAVRAALDERTVLLDYFLGESPKGNVCTLVLLFTRDDTQFTCIETPFPWSTIEMQRDGETSFMPPIALFVQRARHGVVDVDPGARRVDPDAGDELASHERAFLGPFVERLDRLHAAGKNHLLVIPSGPLHFYPWHLLGGPGRLLADKWTVTWTPSANFVLPRPPEAEPRPSKIANAAIGLAFVRDERFGLNPLKRSLEETRAVAATLGATPLLDENATKSVAIAALESARYAHISTHGEMNVAAPSFQCLFFTPDERSDGRLFAYEVLSLDLRGLELLTLSACETALGRFDLGDNVRGLPASFLLAGVRTIVGTQWNANAGATAVFFPALYASLEGGATHRDAFRVAQQTTRANYPKYWDWGAFFLMEGAT